MNEERLLFVSDLHLDAAAPATITQFLALLDQQARRATALYILGDLFESWIGDDDDEPARATVCQALRRYTSDGNPCFVLRGNRDFLLGPGFQARTGCQLLPDPVLLEWGSVRAIISHGDPLCVADVSYQQFRSMVRDERWQRRYLRLPLATRRLLADAARSGSREHTARAGYTIMDVTPATVETAFRIADAQLMIHGHTHRPDVHHLQVDGKSRTRIVLGDWYEQGSGLWLSQDGSHESFCFATTENQ
jgi:UDP-2,3-diacylglucosamine hydrolase